MAGGGGGSEELNLVPYLDIMVNLIMFLITVTAYMAEMRQAPVLAPGEGPGPDQACVGEACKPKPFLNILIAANTIAILGSNSQNIVASQLDKTGPDFDYPALSAKLREYRDNNPDLADNVMLAADRQIPYSTVIAAMDAIREDAKGPLFTGVTLSVAVK